MSNDHKPLRIVTLGGGTGQPQLLRALSMYPEYDVTGIVTTMDSGGSSGILRDEYDMVPPGDVRRALSALVEDPECDAWWNHRISEGSLKGHTVGNLVIAGVVQKYGSMSKALEILSAQLGVRGHVLPVSDEPGTLCAELSDGSILRGEHVIDVPQGPRAPIKKLFLEHAIPLLPGARAALEHANYIFLSCGDVFTSMLPNLLVPGVTDAIKNSNAPVVLVCNRSTKQGETDGWSYQDVYDVVSSYLAPAHISIVMCDNQQTPVPQGAEAFRVSEISGVTMLSGDCADEQDPAHLSLTQIVNLFRSYASLH